MQTLLMAAAMLTLSQQRDDFRRYEGTFGGLVGGGVESDEAKVLQQMEFVSKVRQRFVRPDDPALKRLEVHVYDMLREFTQAHPETPIGRFLRVGPRP